MFWTRRRPTWPIDPSQVAYGCVVRDGFGDLSRTHVGVRYRREAAVQFVPLALFATRCYEAIREGRPLGIDHLLVAPITKQRHEAFFNRLTDWAPAALRARKKPGPGSGDRWISRSWSEPTV